MNNPYTSPQNKSSEEYSYNRWRQKLLQVVLQASCLLGLAAIILYLFSSSTIIVKLLAVLTYGVLVFVTLFTRLPYQIGPVFFFFFYLLPVSLHSLIMALRMPPSFSLVLLR